MTTSAPDTPRTAPPADPSAGGVVRGMSLLDRWLPAWILAAMLLGLALGRFVPAVGDLLEGWRSAASPCPSPSACW